MEALSKNCGSKVHREIASRAFTQSLLRLINDRNTHTKVKSRAAELIKQWADEFSRDPSLGIMTEVYNSIKAQGLAAEPPSRPQKREITDADRRREEEELQMALALSLNESKISSHQGNTGTARNAQQILQQDTRTAIDNGPNAYTVNNNKTQSPYSLPEPTADPSLTYEMPQTQALANAEVPVDERTAATVSRVRALYDFSASEAGELTFYRGDVITVIESAYKDWWRGSLHGHIGIFPTNYVENLPEPTPAELQREAEEERRVFAEAKNVEKLLSILSSAEHNDPALAENEQLQALYHSTISIRPKLVRLIEKYAQKKDDLISLNDKFMKARREYDEMMEASLSRYSNPRPYTGGPNHDRRQASFSSQAPPPMAFQADQRTRQPGNDPRALHSTDPRQPAYSGPQSPPLNDLARQMGPMYNNQQQQAQYPLAQPGIFSQPQTRNSTQSPGHQRQNGHMHANYTGATTERYAQIPSDPYAVQDLQSTLPQTMSPDHHGEISQMTGREQQQQQHPTIPGPYPSHRGGPVSPSQELQSAFPGAPPTDRVSSYDHARATKEGGPPIAYYTEGAQGPGPSEPEEYEEDNAVDPHDYYRGRMN